MLNALKRIQACPDLYDSVKYGFKFIDQNYIILIDQKSLGNNSKYKVLKDYCIVLFKDKIGLAAGSTLHVNQRILSKDCTFMSTFASATINAG